MTHYLSKCSIVTGTYYADEVHKLREALKSKRPGKLRRGLLLLHDNEPAHTSAVVTSAVADHPCSGGRRPGIFSDGPSNATVCIRWVLDRRSGGGRFYWIKQSPPAPCYAVTLRCGKIS